MSEVGAATLTISPLLSSCPGPPPSWPSPRRVVCWAWATAAGKGRRYKMAEKGAAAAEFKYRCDVPANCKLELEGWNMEHAL